MEPIVSMRIAIFVAAILAAPAAAETPSFGALAAVSSGVPAPPLVKRDARDDVRSGKSAGRAVRTFRDCSECPAMVALPGGGLLIGSPESEPGRHGNEGPQRQLQIEAFAVSETEITRRQFRTFLDATHRQVEPGCDTHGDGTDGNWDHMPSASWSDPGFSQTDNHPVVCVTWQDARDYAAWVATRTGQPYRLLTEAEWEYAARAGTAGAFYWGDDEDAACRYANGGDRSLPRALPTWSIAIARAQREGEMKGVLVTNDER